MFKANHYFLNIQHYKDYNKIMKKLEKYLNVKFESCDYYAWEAKNNNDLQCVCFTADPHYVHKVQSNYKHPIILSNELGYDNYISFSSNISEQGEKFWIIDSCSFSSYIDASLYVEVSKFMLFNCINIKFRYSVLKNEILMDLLDLFQILKQINNPNGTIL